MDWTIGLLDYFFGPFFGPFFGYFFGPVFLHLLIGGRGEVGHKYLGRGGMQSISTREGEKKLL